ncbi:MULTISPECIES: hypothetical protein [Catenuloplanes]|uniref:Uncharacterized protein n=1 Tax=Catenuloplanes niger TaxID=587534 RepID=A0AAE4CRU5_9ACTN|nr:hypothetical protein [Catenuloplanes niger]MDR7323351.1 hypothetical protein [Catenuloplanes niger]
MPIPLTLHQQVWIETAGRERPATVIGIDEDLLTVRYADGGQAVIRVAHVHDRPTP